MTIQANCGYEYSSAKQNDLHGVPITSGPLEHRQ